MMLLEGGCCLAELLGCGPQLLFVVPSLLRNGLRSRPSGTETAETGRVAALLLAAIACYQQQISPHRKSCCRYSPTCSHFAADAIRTFGPWRGTALAARRLLRCRPGASGGFDPLPSR